MAKIIYSSSIGAVKETVEKQMDVGCLEECLLIGRHGHGQNPGANIVDRVQVPEGHGSSESKTPICYQFPIVPLIWR